MAEHPAWPGILRRPAPALRADAEHAFDFDSVFRAVADDPPELALPVIVPPLRMAVDIAYICDNELYEQLTSSRAYTDLLAGAAPHNYAGRAGAKAWNNVVYEYADSWNDVLERIDARIDWQGTFDRVDNDAVCLPAAGEALAPAPTVQLAPVLPPAPTYPGYAPAPYTPPGYPGYTPPPYGPPTYPGYGPAPYSGMAIAAFILAFVTSFGIPSVVLGHIAFRDIRTGARSGRGLATAAIALGYIEICFWFILVVFILFGVPHSSGS
jgi:hypothetical protein